MNISVITACLYSNRSRINYLEESCKKHGIDLLVHGEGQPFQDWAHTFYHYTIKHMRELTSSHVLFIDGNDCLFLSRLDEILDKYYKLGSPPCLMAGEVELYPDFGPTVGEKFTNQEPWKYLNAGTYLTEREYFIDLVDGMYQKYHNEGNHNAWFVLDYPIEGLVLDYNCKIFQVMDGQHPYRIDNGRYINEITGSNPNILHFRGGYNDPKTGRAYKIEPFLKELHV